MVGRQGAEDMSTTGVYSCKNDWVRILMTVQPISRQGIPFFHAGAGVQVRYADCSEQEGEGYRCAVSVDPCFIPTIRPSSPALQYISRRDAVGIRQSDLKFGELRR